MIIFESLLTTCKASIIFKAAGKLVKNGWSLKPAQTNITKFDQVKQLAQIHGTHFRLTLLILLKSNLVYIIVILNRGIAAH